MTTATTPATNTLQLAPYVFFYGRCEEALEFYKSAIGGTYELQRIEGSPMHESVSPDFRNKVMHSTFTGSGITFMASDGQGSKTIDPEEGNITLALAASDRATGDRVFAALSAGGTVKMPLSDAFWGGRFGMLVDRFGIEWMLTSP
jgi:PhnB protein